MPRPVAERERFVRDLLKHLGAELSGATRGPFAAKLPPGLKRRLRSQDLVCVFQPEDLEEQPDAELMVPGNPVFDRMLDIARKFGAVSRRYLAPRRDLDIDGLFEELRGPSGIQVEAGPARYRTDVLYTFRVAFRSLENFDQIVAVMYSGASSQCKTTTEFFRDLNLSEAPVPDIDDSTTHDPLGMLPRALETLEATLETAIERFVHEADASLTNERQRLNAFYSELIAEEKSKLARRKRRTESVGAVNQKLEWVQRLDSESRLFKPTVHIELIGHQEVRVPTRLVTVRTPIGRELAAELDLGRGELAGIDCETCGSDLDRIHLCRSEHLACSECLTECAECAGSAAVSIPNASA